MHKLARPSLPPPTPRQLPLPLDNPPEMLSPTTLTTPPAITMTTQQIWASLSPTAQARLRQTMVRILQEVLHVAPES